MDGKTALHFAAENNLLSVCKEILEFCDEDNPEDDDGNTPFHLALMKGHSKVCELLAESALSDESSNESWEAIFFDDFLSKRRKLT